MSRCIYIGLVALAIGCATASSSNSARNTVKRHGPPNVRAPSSSMSAATATRTPRSFDAINPGGMWPPQLVPTQSGTLHDLGIAIDPDELARLDSRILGAIVNVGGCSASFVSPDGLIATNHHCVVRALEYNSSTNENLLEAGFLAATRNDELTCGPSARTLLTIAIRDVTDVVRRTLYEAKGDLERQQRFETMQKELVSDCERTRTNLRCQLVNYYEGLQYALLERLELRDVRLVYAPAQGIGNFGGEVDNWRWPRHTGDVALLRAYVAQDGSPAAYSRENVPYRPAQWLRMAREPLRKGNLVIVAGFPARTSRLKSLYEVEDTLAWSYPRRIRMFEEYSSALERLGATDAEANIKSASLVRGFDNYRTKHLGELEGIHSANLLARKRDEAVRLRASIESSADSYARYGKVLDELSAAFAEYEKTREADTSLEVEISMPRLVSAANRIVRMAEERAKPDLERDPEYQQRNWTTLGDELVSVDKHYHRKVDETLLRLALERSLRIPPTERTTATELLVGKNPTIESIGKAVSKLYDDTSLWDRTKRLALFQHASSKQLQSSADPLIRLAVRLRPLLRAAENRRKMLAGKLLLLKPRYMEALLASLGPTVPPDANGTLRVAYGVVREEPSRADGTPSRAFTTLAEMLAKHKGHPPFDVPEPLLRAASERKLGHYIDVTLNDVPVNFLTDVNISNGNSGSATLNARGELVGIAFDGTYESVASDWMVLEHTRSIHVDIRYVSWLLEEVERARGLLLELGIGPIVR